MIFHENHLPADDSHEISYLKKGQNLKLSSAANYRGGLWVNAGQKYYRMHFAILLTCIKRLSVLKTYFRVFFAWPLETGLTVF